MSRAAYRIWLMGQGDRPNQMRYAPPGYRRRVAPRPPRARYTDEEKRDVCALIAEGWWPMDVAVAYGIPVFADRRGWQTSYVYAYARHWWADYGPVPLTASAASPTIDQGPPH